MLNESRRREMIESVGMMHGAAEAREEHEDVKKGTVGMITAYLPDMETFGVVWPGNKWVTYKCTEEQFDEWFSLSAPSEVLVV